MKKVRQALEKLAYTDLVSLQKDLFNGGTKVRTLVTECIRELEEAETLICSTCGNKVSRKQAENFTLVFGPSEMKKKASFCALDCLQYFFNSMKELSKTVRHR